MTIDPTEPTETTPPESDRTPPERDSPDSPDSPDTPAPSDSPDHSAPPPPPPPDSPVPRPDSPEAANGDDVPAPSPATLAEAPPTFTTSSVPPVPPVSPVSPAPPATPPTPDTSTVGLPLEAEAPEDAEPCPKCGAPLRGDDALVCLRCGYDLRTLESLETQTSVDEIEPESPGPPLDALVRSETAPEWLSFGLAGIAGVVLVIGILAGVQGLYPALAEVHSEAAEGTEFLVAWSARFTALLRLPVLLILWIGAAVGSLRLAAWYWHQPFGSWRSALVRLLAVLLTARMVALLHVPWRPVEMIAEFAGQAVVAVGLIALLFRIPPKKAGLVVLMMTSGYLLLYLLARSVVFVT